jgi:hypothetical protein
MTAKFVAYYRVSTSRQGKSGLGGVDTYLIHKTIAARVMTAR